MRIVITGATGFVGSHLTRALVTDQHEVLALVRRSSSRARLEDVWSDLVPLELEEPETWERLSRQGAQAFIHMATDYGRQGAAAWRLIEANVTLPLRLYDVLKQHDPLFVNTDSFFAKAELGNRYLAAYTKTKQHLLDWLRLFGTKGARVVNMRLEHVFGPHDTPSKFVPAILRRLLANEQHIALSEGTQARDFVFVGDVVQAYQRVLSASGQVEAGVIEYQVGRGEAITVRRFVELMKQTTGSSSTLDFGAIPAKPGEIAHSEADTRSLESLGWRPQVDLTQGLKACIATSRIAH